MRIWIGGAVLAAAGTVHAGGVQSEPPALLDSVDVRGQAVAGTADSATQGTVLAAQLEHRPRLRTAELLEVVPGLIVTQHSGGGKANQYFLRGFNLDHGTDFATTVLGMPVNMPTHGHGQGYTDLNFLIPELVSVLRYRKGPYYAENGDFASAGAAQIEYVSTLEQPFLEAGLGEDGYGRLLGAGSFSAVGGDLLYALELARHDGPWDVPEDLRRANAVLRFSHDAGSVTLMAYDNRWTATDQVPQRALDAGLIGRYGSLDSSDGGESYRYSLSADWQQAGENSALQARVYAIRSSLDLFSNFTYFLDDPANGDQFEQVDQRHMLGFLLGHERHFEWLGRHFHQQLGLQGRRDDIGQVGLHKSAQRRRLSTIRQDAVVQGSLGAHYSLDAEWLPWLRSVAGIRADAYEFDITSNIAANSGKARDHLYSPKLSVVLGPWARSEFFLNAGRGFHSNDARGTTLTLDPSDPTLATPAEKVDALARTRGYELGFKTFAVEGLQSSLALWRLDLDAELVFIGDAGNTEASRPSRREGVEWANYYAPRAGLIVDADMAWSRARFTDADVAGERIPGAIGRTASLGVAWTPGEAWSGGLRLRYFGPRPLVEDNSVRSSSSTLVNLRAGYALRPQLRLALDVFNLFDREVSDIEYFYESRLASEAAGVEDRHLHPAEPRTLRLSLLARF